MYVIGRHRLVWVEWRPAGWSVCLPLFIFPCTTKSRSFLLAIGSPGWSRKKGRKTVVVVVWWYNHISSYNCVMSKCFERIFKIDQHLEKLVTLRVKKADCLSAMCTGPQSCSKMKSLLEICRGIASIPVTVVTASHYDNRPC